MAVLQEFKRFAIRGNVIDLAVGVVIGNAFGRIVSSLVSDILMPPLGLLVSGVKFSHMKLVLKPPVGELPPVTLDYGAFFQSCIDFAIIAFAIFVLVKAINKVVHSQPPAPPVQEVLLRDIRDLLQDIAAQLPRTPEAPRER